MKIYKIDSTGTEIKEIQATLDKLGINVGEIDGIYGTMTADAVKKFQAIFGLLPTGVVDETTNNLFERFIYGYDIDFIRPGDTLYLIGKRYGINMNNILTGNPNLNPYNLEVGQEVVMPYSIDIVNTNLEYTYDIMKKNIKGLKVRYPFIEVGTAGKSVLGNDLYYIKLGNGSNKVFYNGAHHAIEWITAPLLMKFIENYAKAYAEDEKLNGYDIKRLWNKSSIYVMPMVNPDGVDLVNNGLKKDNPYYKDLIKWNGGSSNFSAVWTANIRGVDLNHNYDASWQKSKNTEKQYGIYGPGPTRYSGAYPESEPESKAVADFTRKHDFRLVLAYHNQGEIIYWNYENMADDEAKKIGEMFTKVSGYPLSEVVGITSYAGYKDWFIEKYRRPGYTIEVGLGKKPLPISQFDKIYKDNIGILLLAADV